jgi:hypothetical protein
MILDTMPEKTNNAIMGEQWYFFSQFSDVASFYIESEEGFSMKW